MDLYQISFAVLVITSGWLAWTQHKHELQPPSAKEVGPEAHAHESHGDPNHFRKTFIPVYLLVMGSDWLQVSLLFDRTHGRDKSNNSTGSVRLHSLQRRERPSRICRRCTIHIWFSCSRYFSTLCWQVGR